MIVTTLGSVYRRKLGGDGVSDIFSSYVSFDGTNHGNLGGVLPLEGDTLGILEITEYGTRPGLMYGLVCGYNEVIKIGVSDGEIMGTTLRSEY